MNALVAIRSNQTGFLSPTPAERDSVARTLQVTGAANSGMASAAPGATTSAAAAATTSGAAAAAAAPSGAESGASRTGLGEELGKQTFLELLILQLRYQDPLEPISNSEMLAQLAQFSSLEAQTNLNDNFALMSANIDQLNFISAAQLLGKTVTGVDLNGVLRTGVVEAVHLDGSLVVLTVDGELMSMAGIIGIALDAGDDSGNETDGGDPPQIFFPSDDDTVNSTP